MIIDRHKFTVCKTYFFLLPSIQIITDGFYPCMVKRTHTFVCAIELDWLVFHYALTITKRRNKNDKTSDKK